ncbi:MAG: VOC family protein [Oscillospiraceae bacterium]
MAIKPTHAGITVSDMDKAVQWYEKNLGFTLASRKKYDFMGGMEIAFLGSGEFYIELFCPPNPKEAPEGIYSDNSVIGTKHIAFETDDLAAMLKAFEKNNVRILFEAEMEGDWVCFIEDCCKTPIELIERGAGKAKGGR